MRESDGDTLLQDAIDFSPDSVPCQPKAEAAAAGMTIRRKTTQESTASFGEDSTSVNRVEGRPG